MSSPSDARVKMREEAASRRAIRQACVVWAVLCPNVIMLLVLLLEVCHE